MNKPSFRPANFIFILSDTHRYDAMSFTNPLKDHFEIYTPNMERMAQEGVSFKNCYANLPICSPARAIYQTGRWPFQWGGIANHMDLNDRVDEEGNENKTLGFLFKNAGYSTFHVGKWHQGLENNAQNAGYDESYIWSNERHDSMIYCHNGGDFQDLDPNDILGDGSDIPYTGVSKCDTFSFPAFPNHPYKIIGQTDQALALLDRQDIDASPFFLTLCMQDPHGPFTGTDSAPEWGDFSHRSDYPELYRHDENHPAKALKPYQSYIDNPVYMPYDRIRNAVYNYDYYSSITAVDEQLGRVLDWLDNQPESVRDNTIVIYTSDHGAMGGAQNVAGGQKRWPHDPSSRIPFLVRWHKSIKTPGREANELLSFIDFFPTFCHLAGLDEMLAEKSDKASMESLGYLKASPGVNHSRNIMAESGGPDPDSVFLFHFSNMNSISSPCPIHRTVITKDWVYSVKGKTRLGGKPNWTEWDEPGGWLYDRNKDPFQLDNLFFNENFEAIRTELHPLLQNWMKEAELPFRNRWFEKTTRKNISAWSSECGILSEDEEAMRALGQSYVMNL